MSKVLCVSHALCDDGFAAAWVVRRALGADNVEFYPGVYGQNPPEVTGRDVVLVDFSYKRPVLEAMAEKAKSIITLDHHKTAEADLSDFGLGSKEVRTYRDIEDLFWARDAAGYGEKSAIESASVISVFDMNRSGAGIAWDFFFPN
jgi:hypothetical protein